MNNKYVRHLKTILKHKYYVGKICFKFGLYKQGILHDMSKFSPIEFFTSVKYYQGNRSPIDAEKEDKGYSLAWAHHHNRNPHHWLYWVDFNKVNEITPMKIPYKYALEAIADWIGAGMTYMGDKFTWSEPYEYYKNNTRVNSGKNIHFQTRRLWDTILVDLKLYGLDYVCTLLKDGFYKQIYEKSIDAEGNLLTYDMIVYEKIVDKFYKEGI